MTGRHKIYIMTTSFLEFEHETSQIFWCDFVPIISLADIVVLAVLAAKVAACEKNRSGTPVTSERIFFAHVGSITADLGMLASFTNSLFPFPTIHTAMVCTNVARSQPFVGFGNALAKFTAFK
jgi:hypothetical protein